MKFSNRDVSTTPAKQRREGANFRDFSGDEWIETHVQSPEKYPCSPSGWQSLFLVQTGDNVLDCKLAVDELVDAIHVIEKGLSHRFDGLERYLDKTFDFSYIINKEESMQLYSEILKEIQDGNVPNEFKVSDLIKKPTRNEMFKVGGQVYALSTLRTMLANLAIDEKSNSLGHHLKHAKDAKYIRVSRGLYRLNCNPAQLHAPVVSDENLEQTIQDNSSELIHFDIKLSSAPNSVATYVVEYLQCMPFQYFFKKQNKTHPKKPAQGLNERLNAYFWPDLSVSWHSTQQEIQSYVTQFKSIEFNKNQPDTAEKLLALFANICRWGGVKLPNISASDLKRQVFSVLDILDNGGVPDSSFTINSAYTKLYAIARPDSFVIFDSRVAAALTSIIDLKYRDLDSLPDWSKYESLGFVNGRGGSRPRLLVNKWKNGYQKWSAQISANKLCQDMVEIINKNHMYYGFSQAISLRELEAILFMEGY